MALEPPFKIQAISHCFLLCTAAFKQKSFKLGKVASCFLFHSLPPPRFSKTSMAILGLVSGPHLLGAFSVKKTQLGSPAGPALQRETSNTGESVTCHVHNEAMHHQLHGLKQVLHKKISTRSFVLLTLSM